MIIVSINSLHSTSLKLNLHVNIILRAAINIDTRIIVNNLEFFRVILQLEILH